MKLYDITKCNKRYCEVPQVLQSATVQKGTDSN